MTRWLYKDLNSVSGDPTSYPNVTLPSIVMFSMYCFDRMLPLDNKSTLIWSVLSKMQNPRHHPSYYIFHMHCSLFCNIVNLLSLLCWSIYSSRQVIIRGRKSLSLSLYNSPSHCPYLYICLSEPDISQDYYIFISMSIQIQI